MEFQRQSIDNILTHRIKLYSTTKLYFCVVNLKETIDYSGQRVIAFTVVSSLQNN